MGLIKRLLRGFREQEEGNFIILSIFFLMLFVLLFFFVQDALKKSTLEENLQKLTDNAALYAASYVPSISVNSYLSSTTPLTSWQQQQGYNYGDYILSTEQAEYVDALARSAVQDYLRRNATTNEATGYFGGNLEVVRVNPKLVARDEGSRQVIEYYLEVELGTKWGSFHLARADDVRTTALARATVEYNEVYSTTEEDYDNPEPISVFAKGIYSKKDVKLNNINDFHLIGDIHSNTEDVGVAMAPGGNVLIEGNLSASTSVDLDADSGTTTGSITSPAIDVDLTVGGGLLGDENIAPAPDIDMPELLPPTGTDDPNWNHPIVIFESGNITVTDGYGYDAGDIAAWTAWFDGWRTTQGDYAVNPSTQANVSINGDFPPPGFPEDGTLYAKDGQFHVHGASVIEGSWSFVAEDQIHVNNADFAAVGDGEDDHLFWYSTDSIHLNNVNNATVVGSYYVNSSNTSHPGIHFNNCDFMLIEGGLFSNAPIHINNVGSLTIKAVSNPNPLPPPLTNPAQVYSAPPQYSSPVVVLIH